MFDARRTVDGAEETVGQRVAARVGPVVGDILLLVLDVAPVSEAVHAAPVDRGDPIEEAVAFIADPIRRTTKGDRPAVTGRSLRDSVGAGGATEHRVERSVL